jgi:two-component system chemotaxis sensor kinase CheA
MEGKALFQFIDESYENINIFESKLFELEKDFRNQNIIQTLYRSMHTIKGLTSFSEFQNLGTLVHKTESLFSYLAKQNGEERAKNIETNNLINFFFKLVDNIKEQLKLIETGKKDLEAPEMLEELELYTKKIQKTQKRNLSPLQLKALQQLQSTDQRSVEVNDKIELDDNILIKLDTLETLSSLNSELILSKNQLGAIIDNQKQSIRDLNTCFHKIDRLIQRISDRVTQIRLQPLSSISNKLRRVTRDIAETCNKDIELEIHGQEIEVDRAVLDAIKNPLIHIIRNSIDHGIESNGRIIFEAKCQENRLMISVADNGRGIDKDKVLKEAVKQGLISPWQTEKISEKEIYDIIFCPNFSTKEEVSSVSGRGIGLDIVKENITKIGGSIEVFSKSGVGTTFDITVPLTLAIDSALIVEIKQENFAIPRIAIKEIQNIAKDQIIFEENRMSMELRDESLELVDGRDLLGKQKNRDWEDDDSVPVIVIETGYFKYGFIVDSTVDLQDVVIKAIPKEASSAKIYAGATILPSGTVALILDMEKFYITQKNQSDNLENTTINKNLSNMKQLRKIVSFNIGGYNFGIDYSVVKEITVSRYSTPIPGSAIDSLMNLRNAVVLSKKLRRMLDVKEEMKDNGVNIVLNVDGSVVSVRVDDINEIIKFDDDWEEVDIQEIKFKNFLLSAYLVKGSLLYIMNEKAFY